MEELSEAHGFTQNITGKQQKKIQPQPNTCKTSERVCGSPDSLQPTHTKEFCLLVYCFNGQSSKVMGYKIPPVP